MVNNVNRRRSRCLGVHLWLGPYAFMDVFDSGHICNHTDEEGRYAYKVSLSLAHSFEDRNQSRRVTAPAKHDVCCRFYAVGGYKFLFLSFYALRSLLTTLAPLIGAELNLKGKAVSSGWADSVTKDEIAKWKREGLQAVEEDLEKVVEEECSKEYGILMRKVRFKISHYHVRKMTKLILQRLGLRRRDSNDEKKITRPLLNLMEEHHLDFHSTFRLLATFRPSFLGMNE